MNIRRLFGRERRDADSQAHPAVAIQDSLRVLEDIRQDMRYALRGMRRSPGVTAVIVVSLALGIGANTAIFSLVYSVMLRGLPVAHPEELVELLQKYPGEPRGNGYWSPLSYEHYRDNNHVFAALTGTAIDNASRLRVEGSDAETVVAEYVIGNYFPVLGVQPALGRLIGPEHDPATPEGAAVVVSWSLWHSRFRQDPDITGKRILVDGKPVSIIGVAPRGFTGLRANAQTSLWLPAKPKAGLNLLGRLKRGVSLEQARAEMALLFRFTVEERSAGDTDPQIRHLRVELEPARAGLADVRDRAGKPLSVLMTIAGVLLLLACVNVAGLLLARGAGRAREMALRLGLGASRGRLMRQVLTESLLLSGLGTAAGGVVAYFGTAAMLRILDSGRPHERIHLVVRTDGNLILFAAGAAILTGLLFGLAPAWSALRNGPAGALRQTGRASETRFHRYFGRALAATQVALSMVLLSTGGLFIAHLANLKSTDLGFRRDGVLLAELNPSGSGYEGQRLSNAYRELMERLRAIPGVRSVSLSAPTPLLGAGASGFGTAEGFEERPEDRRWISISYVAPDYFQTLEIPLLSGREFGFQDQANPRVAIINQTLARHYFAHRDPIGKRITLDHVTLSREPATYEIVGVAGDANYMEIREAERREIYLPAFRNGRVIAGAFVIRTDVEPASIAGGVRRVVRETVPAILLAKITTLSDQIDASIVPERLLATLSGFFAALGALLAGIGVYGLLAYTVARRTNEIGIRAALGATPAAVLKMILAEGLAIAGAGLILGAPAVFWGRALAAAMIQGLTENTGATVGLGAAAIAAVALAASYGPARRAAHVDPMEALRHE